MSTLTETSLTAEAFARMPDPGYPTELVRGKVIAMPVPGFRHGQVCGKICRLVGAFTDEQKLGHLLTNDAGVITERGPDSVRGADLSFYRSESMPPGPGPAGYASVAPDLVFEVLSPSDRWSRVYAKVAEYLDAGVRLVVVVDPKTSQVQLYRSEEPTTMFGLGDEFTAPEILGAFRVPVSRFFE